MKKRLLSIIATAVAISLSACNSGNSVNFESLQTAKSHVSQPTVNPSTSMVIQSPEIPVSSTTPVASEKTGNVVNKGKDMKVKISVGERVFTSTLKDNATTRDFVSLLPLTLNMDDYARTEKINYLSRKLMVSDDVPAGDTPTVGDIGYYAPWGNLIIYYKDFAYSSGLVKLGKIDSGIEAFNGSGNLLVKFEVID